MKRFSIAALLALSFIGARAADVASNDWPTFRGPNRDDVSTETGLLKKWPAEGPKLLWKGTGCGSGYSTVSIAGDKIFTMGDMEGSSELIALNLKDGSPAWKTKIGKSGGDHPGTRCTPTVDGPAVYAINQFGELICAATADGKEIWRKDMKEFGGQMMSGWGYSESPLVDGNLLICTPGGSQGTILALDKKSGAKVWQSSEIKDKAAYSSVIAVDIGGVHQYIQVTGNAKKTVPSGHVFGVDAKTGKVLWSAERNGDTAVVPTPIYYDGYVFTTSGYGSGCHWFKVVAEGGKFTATQVYAKKEMEDHHGGVVRVGEYVYGHSGRGDWTCMELKTGKVMWQNPGVRKGSVTYADGHLYTRSEGGAGTIALVEAMPTAYKEDGSFNPPNRARENSWAHPVVCGGKLFIRDQDVLLCYDVKNN